MSLNLFIYLSESLAVDATTIMKVLSGIISRGMCKNTRRLFYCFIILTYWRLILITAILFVFVSFTEFTTLHLLPTKFTLWLGTRRLNLALTRVLPWSVFWMNSNQLNRSTPNHSDIAIPSKLWPSWWCLFCRFLC